jgi:hypothetical protein
VRAVALLAPRAAGTATAAPNARIVVAGDLSHPDEVPVLAIRGNVEDTGNAVLAGRAWCPLRTPSPNRPATPCTNRGRPQMLDHMLITRNLLPDYRGSEIHNELLHDDFAAFAVDRKYPEVRSRPVVATVDLDH